MTQMTIQQALALAMQLQNAGKLAEGEGIFRQVLAAQPRNAQALHLLGRLALQVGRAEAAAELIGRSIALNPNSIEAQNELANALMQLNRVDDAIAAYRAILSRRPDLGEVHSNLGHALLEQGKFDEAIQVLRQAVTLGPKLPDAHNNLANALQCAEQFDEAVDHYQKALDLRPAYPQFHLNLGQAFLEQDKLEEGIAEFQKAIELDPGFMKAYNYLGGAYQQDGRMQQAIAVYRDALSRHPDAPASIHFNLGIALLREGNFEEGWAEYDWRLRVTDFNTSQPEFAQPRWDGGNPEGKRLLILVEQGFGDAIQFSRYIPQVAEQGAKVIVACAPELERLMRCLDGVSEVIVSAEATPQFDLHFHSLSLPGLFKTTLETIPNKVPYLHADREASSRWKERLAEIDGMKVGLVWAGSQYLKKNFRKRSFMLSSFAPLADVPGVKFISLQKGDAAEQAHRPPAGMNLVDWTSELIDFAETAALIENLDLVVTIDTSVAHLAGALGKPVWVLLAKVPDWRWMMDRDDSPWYPSMRLFRQQRSGDWETPIQQVRQELSRLAEQRAELTMRA